MPISLTSPNVDNYYVGKGIVSIKIDGEDSDYIDVGNVTELEFTPKVDKLEHFSSRAGIKEKDKTVIVQKSAELRMVMEEFTARNLSLLLLGAVSETSGVTSIDILSQSSRTAAVKFVGANDVGPAWTFEFPAVEFSPSKSINPISSEWGQIEVTGDVLVSGGTFGTATCTFPA